MTTISCGSVIAAATPTGHEARLEPEATRRLGLALVTETFAPEINGVAMTLGRLVDGLSARGHRVCLVRPRRGDIVRNGESQGNGLATCFRPGLPIPGYPELRFGLPSVAALRSQWRVSPPDVVHIATEGPLGFSALRAAHDLRLPVTSTFHTNFHEYSSHYRIGFLGDAIAAYLRRFHNRTACTLVPSMTMRNRLVELGFDRVNILARGVDTALFKPQRRDPELRRWWGAGDQTLVCCLVGRLAAEKNLDLAVRAWQRIRATRPDTLLVLVGDGPERERLIGTEGIILAGTRRGEDLARHYASADCFLFPSVTETYGNVVAEALASGLACLAFAYAAAAERINNGVDGLLVPFGDAEAFVARAPELVAAGASPDAPMRHAARMSVRDLGWDRIIERFEGILLRVAGRQEVVP